MLTDQSKSLKIVHCTRTLDPAAGGLPVVAMRLAATAAHAGHRVTLISEGPERMLGEEQRSIAGLSQVEFRFAESAGASILLTRMVSDKAFTTINDADIVHLHGAWDPILVNAAHIAYRASVPYIIAPHGMLDPWSLGQSRLKKMLARHTTHRSFFRRASGFHALNATEASLWKPLGLTGKAHVVPNGIDLQEIPPRNETRLLELRRRLGIQNPKTILFLGRLHFKKGLDILAQAFRIVAQAQSNVDLVVVGPDDGALAAFLAAVSSHGLQDRVIVAGALFGQDKYDAFRLGTVYCLPSRQEGFSVAVLEAIACGTAVVLSHDCHFDEVQEAGIGRVCTLNPVDVAEKLLTLLANDPMLEQIRHRGPSWIEDNYTWRRANNMLIQSYRNRIAEKALSLRV